MRKKLAIVTHFAEPVPRKRILVTGRAGFVGSHLYERLVADEHDVLVADNYFTGSKESIAALTTLPQLKRCVMTSPARHMSRLTKSTISLAQAAPSITSAIRGAQTHAFCHVNDSVDGLVRLMATPDALIGPVNLGNPHEIFVRELIEHTLQHTGSRSRIVSRPLSRCPDTTLAGELLNDWKPTVPLENGLSRTIDYFDRLLSARPRRRGDGLSRLQ